MDGRALGGPPAMARRAPDAPPRSPAAGSGGRPEPRPRSAAAQSKAPHSRARAPPVCKAGLSPTAAQHAYPPRCPIPRPQSPVRSATPPTTWSPAPAAPWPPRRGRGQRGREAGGRGSGNRCSSAYRPAHCPAGSEPTDSCLGTKGMGWGPHVNQGLIAPRTQNRIRVYIIIT